MPKRKRKKKDDHNHNGEDFENSAKDPLEGKKYIGSLEIPTVLLNAVLLRKIQVVKCFS